MRLIAITTCTDRKKFPVPYELAASHLPAGPQSNITSTWRARIRSAPTMSPATGVYSGRSFQEAVLAARAGRAEFRVICGGLGLVRGDELFDLGLFQQLAELMAKLMDRFRDVGAVVGWCLQIGCGVVEPPLDLFLRQIFQRADGRP
jgi:hypothetical protein